MNGRDLIAMGFEPGPHFAQMIQAGIENPNITRDELAAFVPPPIEIMVLQTSPEAVRTNITYEPGDIHVESILASMNLIMQTPGVKAGAIMPDACISGPPGTIPVGGVVASENIHPGMHSADICCSVMLSTYPGLSPQELMSRVHDVTHFGPGGREHHRAFSLPNRLQDYIVGNPYTTRHLFTAQHHLGTQGDGNHFAFVGTLKSTGETTLVTHHGSRGFGAKVYKEGMRVAEQHRQKHSPDTLKQNAWIPYDSEEGVDYWRALHIVRWWTKVNHDVLHDAVGKRGESFWNEHNFVFQKSDGLFYHAKGATPAFNKHQETLVPLNMAEPVLITRGSDNPNSLGFSPHGAGRDSSRTKFRNENPDWQELVPEHLDVRFYCGVPDPTELPAAYKNAQTIRKEITRYDLADVVDEVIPFGCIMAGDWEVNAPWRKK